MSKYRVIEVVGKENFEKEMSLAITEGYKPIGDYLITEIRGDILCNPEEVLIRIGPYKFLYSQAVWHE